MSELTPEQLLAEAEAHDARMKSEWWSPSDGKRDESWLGPITDAAADGDGPRRRARTQDTHSAFIAPTNPPELDELKRTIEQLRDAMNQRPVGSEDMPAWLLEAAGNPRTYDAPDPSRVNVCGRMLPSTYERLKAAQKRFKLRTTAGAWEFLLRLGLSTAERLKIQ